MEKMRIFLVTLFLLTGVCFVNSPAQEAKLQEQTERLLSYQEEISAEYLKEHLSALSADSMEGRETGMPGQKKAAKYLAEQYEQIGLKPVGDDSSYFQRFELHAQSRDSTVYKVYRGGEEEVLVERSVSSGNSAGSFIRLFGGNSNLSGEIVYAGFGINDPERGVSHLEGIKLKDKWVMVFQDIPNVVDGDTLINPAIDFRARFGEIINRRQAAGIILIPAMGEEEFAQSAQASLVAYKEPSGMGLKYLDDTGGGFPRGYNMIDPSLAAELLGIENGLKGLKEARRELVKNIDAFAPRATKYKLKHTPYSSQITVDTENVVALLEGTDSKLKDEVIVLTSHYDHLGIGQPDSTGDAIYNGADDDGSGTVAILNIAKVLSNAKEGGAGPKRSVLVLHVSGEEKGLLGSRYYSDHPIFSMDKTVANINIDMIGRIDEEHRKKGVVDYSYIIGSEIISSDLDSLVKVANAHSGKIQLNKKYNDLRDPNQFYRRSDHWNFGRLGVPFVFFFTGVHEDYHRPSDEIHKIRFDKLETITKTIYATTVVLANTSQPPEVDNQAFIEITKSQPR